MRFPILRGCLVLMAFWLGFASGEVGGKLAQAARRSSLPSSFLRQCGSLCRQRPVRLNRRQLQRVMNLANRRLTYHQRIALYSQMFLGTKYHYGPLGEGRRGKYDRDPTFRLDKVDCLTFLETVMAMALSKNLRQAKVLMQKLRYHNGIVKFAFRNHFAWSQWLKENQRLGAVKVITRHVGGRYVRRGYKRIDENTWKGSRWRRRWKQRVPAFRLPRSTSYRFIHMKDIHKVARNMPSVAWVGVVAPSSTNPVIVRHVGMFVWVRGRLHFRHANGKVNVTQLPIRQYVQRLRRWNRKVSRSRQMIGFIVASFHKPRFPSFGR